MARDTQDTISLNSIMKWLDDHRLVALVLIIIVCGALYGVMNYFSSRSPFNVTGTMALSDTTSFEKDKTCSGTGGYSDITEGAQVKVSDGSGNIVAVSELGSGNGNDYGECIFEFNVDNIPYSNIYQFEVSKRGEISYNRQKLVDNEYRVDLQLGE